MELFEDFAKLKNVQEDVFDVSKDGIGDLKEFVDDTDADGLVDIYDVDYKDKNQKSHENDVILDCSVCHSKMYKAKKDVKLDEDADLANVGEECPYCHSKDGYKIVGEMEDDEMIYEGLGNSYTYKGKVICYDDKDDCFVIKGIDDTFSTSEDAERFIDGKLKESLVKKRNLRRRSIRKLGEDVESISVSTDSGDVIDIAPTDDGNVQISTSSSDDTENDVFDDDISGIEDISDFGAEDELDASEEEPNEEEGNDETIQPVSPETEMELEGETPENFDEESFDEVAEAYLRKMHPSITRYRTESVKRTRNGRKYVIEGRVRNRNGNVKKTQFVFESVASGKYPGRKVLLGENKDFTPRPRSCELVLRSRGNKVKYLFTESLRYHRPVITSNGRRRVTEGLIVPRRSIQISESRVRIPRKRVISESRQRVRIPMKRTVSESVQNVRIPRKRVISESTSRRIVIPKKKIR